MLPGKKYKPEDLLQILRRRIWVLLVPFAVVSAMTAAVARKLPDSYRSETLIQVVPQRVPEGYVKSTVTTPIESRLQSISQQIMSRTKLEQIIQEFDLYAKERRDGIMEDVVEQMRRDISIQTNRGDTFTVSYTGRDPRTVKNVTERLASLFIDQSLHDRALLAEGTDQFLEAQLEEAKRRLVDQEKKLEAYRTKYSGQLPSQVDANLQAVHNTMQTVQTMAESIGADRARRLLLEKSLKELESEAPPDAVMTTPSPASGSPDAASNGSTAQQLEAATQTLTVMRQHMLDTHPDVKRQKRFVDGLQKKLDAELLEHPVSTDPIAALPPAEQARQRRMQALKDDIEAIDRQIAAREAEQQRLQKVAASYQARVEAVPARESEMTELTRDYSTLSAFYTSLRQKKEESKISANLERRQAGEQFSLLDPARMPEKPSSPNRPQMNGFGMAAGLCLGLGLIALLEYRDSSFKTDDEVTVVLSLPVLAVVPVMQSDDDRRRARKRRLALNVGLGSTVAACLTLLVYTFVLVR